MSIKRKSPYVLALFAGLIVFVSLGTTTAYSQNEDVVRQMSDLLEHQVDSGARLGIMGGTCFHADASSQYCPVFQVDFRWIPDRDNEIIPSNVQSRFMPFNPGAYTGSYAAPPRRRRVASGFSAAGFQATALAAPSNTWPDPDPPPGGPPDSNIPAHNAKVGNPSTINKEQLTADHEWTLTSLAELVLVIPVPPKFSLAPSVGVGVTHIREGQAKDSTQYAIAEQTMFAASYAAEIDVRLDRHWDLRFQFRGIVHFPGTLTYIDAEGESYDVDVATVSVSNLLIGVGYRF